MPHNEFNLAALFEPDQDFGARVSAAAEKGVSEASTGVKNVIAHLRWGAIDRAVRDKAGELLDQDVSNLVAAAWKKFGILFDLAAETVSGKDTAAFPLGEHTVHSELHPYLEIKIGALSYKLVLDVSADIILKGLVLKIEKGKITSVSSGSCAGKGEIKWKAVSLLKREFKPVELAGRIHFDEGIALASNRAA